MTEKVGSAVKAGGTEMLQKQEKPVIQTSPNIFYKPNGHAELYYLLRNTTISEPIPTLRNEEIVKFDYVDTETGEIINSKIVL